MHEEAQDLDLTPQCEEGGGCREEEDHMGGCRGDQWSSVGGACRMDGWLTAPRVQYALCMATVYGQACEGRRPSKAA